jgi:nucleoside-diphosphate-sugar epimerase
MSEDRDFYAVNLMKIAIIGCGYLGLSLAKELYKKGHFVTCTTTNPDTIKKLSQTTQKSLILNGNDEKTISLILNDNDIIILTVGTHNNNDYENTFINTAKTLKNCAINLNSPKKIIYTSKSSIYGDHHGMWVDESASLNAKDEESKILIDTENILLSLKDIGWKVCLLRVAQIYGPQRSIFDLFKSTYKNIMPGDGKYYTNMVHLLDVIGIITYVIEKELIGIFNVADDGHPTRQEFADMVCTKLNLSKPKYDPRLADFPDNNKRISNYRIKEKGYIFKYPNRVFNF